MHPAVRFLVDASSHLVAYVFDIPEMNSDMSVYFLFSMVQIGDGSF